MHSSLKIKQRPALPDEVQSQYPHPLTPTPLPPQHRYSLSRQHVYDMSNVSEACLQHVAIVHSANCVNRALYTAITLILGLFMFHSYGEK